MKIKTTYLIYPILILIVIVIGCVFAFEKLNVKQATLGYDYKTKLFQTDKLNTIELTVSEKNWNEILENPTAEEYVEADITINGESYSNVGVRAKGNSSLSSIASSDSDRYSLKINFAEYNDKQSYYGLEKINLNNNFSDSTMIKEYVSYTLMSQFGIQTPSYSFVKLTLNGEYYGLMLAVEEIGEAFVRTNYNTSDGIIFKPEDTGSDLKYTSDNIKDYTGILNGVKYAGKVVEKESNIVNMMKEISNYDYSSLDIDEVIRYFALNTAMVNMDSYQGTFKHNYYLYENKDGQFSIIPWDYNMSFGGFTGFGGGGGFGRGERNQANNANNIDGQQGNNQNANQQIRENVANNTDNTEGQNQNRNRGNFGGGMLNMGSGSLITDTAIQFSIYSPVSGTSLTERPLLNVVLQNEETLALYEQYMEEIATDLFSEENIKSIVEPLEALLYEAVDTDPTKFFTTEKFIEGIRGEDSIVNFALQRGEAILSQLNDNTLTVVDTKSSVSTNSNQSSSGQASPNMGNGEMPNFGDGEMPNFGDGEMPNFGDGEMPNFGDGEKPNFEGGGMPNFSQGRNNSQSSVVEYSGKQVAITLAASIGALLITFLVINVLSNRKYARRRK